MISNSDNKYKQLRLKNNLTIVEASQLLGVSKGTMRSVERGVQKPGIKLKFRMCEIYKTSLDQLL